MNTNISISAAQLDALRGKALEIKNNADANRSTLSNMMAALLAADPELTPDQAATVCRNLIKGVTNFAEVYGNLETADEANVDQTVYNTMIAQIQDMTPEAQASCMINFIAMVRAIDARNIEAGLSADNSSIADDFKAFASENTLAEGAVVTPEMLDELRAQLKEVVENNTMALAGVNEVKGMIQTVAAGEQGAISDALNAQMADADSNAYIALAAYIAAKKGEIELPADVDPMLLGTSVAAGNARQHIINQAVAGKISWEKAAKLIKLVGAALMVGIFGWFAICLFGLVAGVTVIASAALLGNVLPIVIMGVVIGSFFGYKSVKWVYDTIAAPVAQTIGKAYDRAVEMIATGELVNKVKDAYHRFVASLKRMWESIKGAAVSIKNAPIAVAH